MTEEVKRQLEEMRDAQPTGSAKRGFMAGAEAGFLLGQKMERERIVASIEQMIELSYNADTGKILRALRAKFINPKEGA